MPVDHSDRNTITPLKIKLSSNQRKQILRFGKKLEPLQSKYSQVIIWALWDSGVLTK